MKCFQLIMFQLIHVNFNDESFIEMVFSSATIADIANMTIKDKDNIDNKADSISVVIKPMAT